MLAVSFLPVTVTVHVACSGFTLSAAPGSHHNISALIPLFLSTTPSNTARTLTLDVGKKFQLTQQTTDEICCYNLTPQNDCGAVRPKNESEWKRRRWEIKVPTAFLKEQYTTNSPFLHSYFFPYTLPSLLPLFVSFASLLYSLSRPSFSLFSSSFSFLTDPTWMWISEQLLNI